MTSVARRPQLAFVPSAVIALLVFSAGGCSSSSSTASNEKPASASIGKAGGVVAASDGSAKLTIPAGAVTTTTVFTLTPATSSVSGAVGQVWNVGPEGTQFATPATLTLAYTASEIGSKPASDFAVSTVVGSAWQPLPAQMVDTAGSTISASLAHLSPYALTSIGGGDAGGGGGGGGPGLCVGQATPTSTCNQSTLACPQPLIPGGVAGACPAASLIGCCVLSTEATCYYTASAASIGTMFCPGLGGTWQTTLP